eukprot:6191359-Pleurochrysis_carterae.AAC.5
MFLCRYCATRILKWFKAAVEERAHEGAPDDKQAWLEFASRRWMLCRELLHPDVHKFCSDQLRCGRPNNWGASWPRRLDRSTCRRWTLCQVLLHPDADTFNSDQLQCDGFVVGGTGSQNRSEHGRTQKAYVYEIS